MKKKKEKGKKNEKREEGAAYLLHEIRVGGLRGSRFRDTVVEGDVVLLQGQRGVVEAG